MGGDGEYGAVLRDNELKLAIHEELNKSYIHHATHMPTFEEENIQFHSSLENIPCLTWSTLSISIYLTRPSIRSKPTLHTNFFFFFLQTLFRPR
jgi:hypothetical protein